ncbi:helix-turn-helix domain-containing protein [Chryseobacterium arthrosphaerae]|uniref:helix-turn-helix domain-containing protein n=1 Tax=Chryseobacterium arthrosphaerae TaxID=651561 RepID=UPI001F4A4377|nr:helix-turn-helix domain-containing protein [Chryseobacterium arthrosphaerae]MDG4654303.1 helix-turn-helix domain-containing protein [Chryseobacterium arthrosphaerae]
MEQPNYKKIFTNILETKYPEKIPYCQIILNKKRLSSLDVLTINNIIFNNPEKAFHILHQKHKSYDKNTIMELLNYQKKHQLNNTELAKRFKLSRNTVAQWKNKFQI